MLLTDSEYYAHGIEPLLGKTVELHCVPDATTVKERHRARQHAPSLTGPSTNYVDEPEPPPSGPVTPAKPSLVRGLAPDHCVIPLAAARPESSGAKAAACVRLADLAQESERDPASQFSAPAGVVLGFGTMEAAIKARMS